MLLFKTKKEALSWKGEITSKFPRAALRSVTVTYKEEYRVTY